MTASSSASGWFLKRKADPAILSRLRWRFAFSTVRKGKVFLQVQDTTRKYAPIVWYTPVKSVPSSFLSVPEFRAKLHLYLLSWKISWQCLLTSSCRTTVSLEWIVIKWNACENLKEHTTRFEVSISVGVYWTNKSPRSINQADEGFGLERVLAASEGTANYYSATHCGGLMGSRVC